MNAFITYLYRRLLETLPGFRAQSKMMPKGEQKLNHFEKIPKNAVSCSVLILLQLRKEIPSVLITLRSSHLSTHQGQLSFPGGKIEPFETPEQAALRETFEEVGLNPNKITLIGRLSSFYMSHTNMAIQPVVGVLEPNSDAEFNLNKNEVDEAFWISLHMISAEESILTELWNLRDLEFKVPFWKVHSEVPLWGATAMMLAELVEIYQEFRAENIISK